MVGIDRMNSGVEIKPVPFLSSANTCCSLTMLGLLMLCFIFYPKPLLLKQMLDQRNNLESQLSHASLPSVSFVDSGSFS